MEKMNIQQVQKQLLAMASTINEICQKHDIPLFMISGTMLGAIRHKGFIPWDDDMDFAVLFEDYQTLIHVLKKDLPEKYRCIIYNESETYKIPWIKVEDLDTRVYDYSLNVSEGNMPGLTVDIFPLVSCQQGQCEGIVRKIQRWIKIKRAVYTYSTGTNNIIKNRVKRLLSAVFPISQEGINDKIMKLTKRIPSGDYYIIPMDPNYSNRYFPCQWFKPLTKYGFEDSGFYGVAQYDSYLKKLYNNYMDLPPVEKRRIHCDNVFYK